MTHSKTSHMAGAVDDSTINIVVVIIIIIVCSLVVGLGPGLRLGLDFVSGW